MLKKILSVLFVILGLLLLAGLYYWVVFIQGYPWWFGASVIMGIFGLIVSLLFLKKFFLRARERKFVQRIIDQDEAIIQDAPVSARYQLQDLQARWKKSIDELRQSHLRASRFLRRFPTGPAAPVVAGDSRYHIPGANSAGTVFPGGRRIA